VDDLAVFAAGLALGADARPGLGALGLAALADAPRFTLQGTEVVGDDVLMRWTRSVGAAQG
jgi:diaminohydroxyphosphoribosylaminopyrimidine deaminase/5-amino-6-(5-phosphoribosylamino)uracil reductase